VITGLPEQHERPQIILADPLLKASSVTASEGERLGCADDAGHRTRRSLAKPTQARNSLKLKGLRSATTVEHTFLRSQ
jgi:hypothetical protein